MKPIFFGIIRIDRIHSDCMFGLILINSDWQDSIGSIGLILKGPRIDSDLRLIYFKLKALMDENLVTVKFIKIIKNWKSFEVKNSKIEQI